MGRQLGIFFSKSKRGRYLGSTKKSITMAQSDGLCLGGNCQVSNIHASLTTSYNQDILVNTKLLSLLKLRRMNNSRDIADSFNDGDVWSDMQARADGNSIAGIFQGLAVLDILDNVLTIDVRKDAGDGDGELDVFLELELLDVSLEIDAVLGCRKEVRRIRSVAVIGESGKLSGRDELQLNLRQRVAFLTFLEEYFAMTGSRGDNLLLHLHTLYA